MHLVVLQVIDISAQILLKCLVLPFSLSVYMQMVCGTEPVVDA